MDNKSKQKTIGVSESQFDKIRRLRIAFSYTSGKICGTREVIDELLSAIEKVNPAVANMAASIQPFKS